MKNLFKKSFILTKNNNYKVFETSNNNLKKKFLLSEKEKNIKNIVNNNIQSQPIKKFHNKNTINTEIPHSNVNQFNQNINIVKNKKVISKNPSRINNSKSTINELNANKNLANKKLAHKNIKNNHKNKFKIIKSNFISKYSKVACYITDSGIKNMVIKDIANGFNVKPEPIKFTPCDGLNVTFGILRGSEILLKNCKENKKDFLYIDHAYFMRGHNNGYQSYYRTILNDLHCNYIDENADDTRLKMFNVKYKNWKKNGSLILICPPTDAIINFYGVENWLENTIEQLRKYTDKPFKIKFKKVLEAKKMSITKETKLKKINNYWKEKYKQYVCEKPIEEDYEKAWCLVTFSSTVALEAILNGVPVICGEECCAYPVAQHSLDKIEEPIYPDIYKWLCTLANHQFSRQEMASGYAWKFLGL